eukprot:SAG22_NODE_11680_length_474_cov_0.826667_1_plen_140_part_01
MADAASAPDGGAGDPVIDRIIAQLRAFVPPPPEETAPVRIKLDEKDLKHLLAEAKKTLKEQPCFLELGAPLRIVGDVHGQYSDLLRLFGFGGFPPEANYLFLGDYVDRGPNSLETACLLLCYKVKFAGNFFLLRGNHEAE